MRPEFIQTDVPLAPFTAWQIGGPAQYYCSPQNLDHLRRAVMWAQSQSLRWVVLGGGTNVLVSDTGVTGLVIHTRHLTGLKVAVRSNPDLEVGESLCLEAWTGTPKSELLKTFLKHQLAPARFLGGLPGDVGGGVVMNAGVGESVVPREFGELVEWVEVLKTDSQALEVRRYLHDDIQWNYRHSDGWQPGIVTQVGLRWPLQVDPQIRETVREANTRRLKTQPLEWPSCGSVFRNPPNDKAGRLIESCGLKGFKIGMAQVSEKHANFIVNLGGAKAIDVKALIEKVQQTVMAKTGIGLHPEVVYLE